MPNEQPNLSIPRGDDIGISNLRRQKAASFTLDRVLATIDTGIGSG